MKTPKCRLCGSGWWVEVFKLEYRDHGPDGKFATVREAARETRNQRFQCAKCGAILDVDYESGSVTYHLEVRHGNIDMDEIVRAIEQKNKVNFHGWPPKGFQGA